ncbi:MAG: hypothetical protein ACO1NX_05455 [Chitinophagaceae bacterium]
MERVQVLIDKLVQQKKANESAAQMLYTVQLLQTELAATQQQNEKKSSRKVAVVMPANFAAQQAPPTATQSEPEMAQKEKETFVQAEQKSEPVAEIPAPAAEVPKPQPAKQQQDLFGNEAYSLKRPATIQPEEKGEEPVQPNIKEEEPQPVSQQPALMPPPHPVTTPLPAEPQPFDALAETPTLLQHIPPQVETPKEINQLIRDQQPSLNDRLKQDKTELAHKLKDAPIKDLRKAIGINDRFVFVNELFRGDEVMYERSIKTINGFHILQEAEYWMNRELKVKLGWSDTKEAVQHFYSLVRRRFS